jgi:hypothetical protein
MIDIDVQVNSDAARAFLNRVQGAFNRGEHEEVVAGVAAKSFGRMVRATPKGYTGYTRKEWQLQQTGRGEWWVHNDSEVMRHLEYGTRAHGPKTKKALYIPLNRKAAVGGWHDKLVFGQDYVLAKRVKGIKPMGIVAAEKERAEADLQTAMRRFLSGLLDGRGSRTFARQATGG